MALSGLFLQSILWSAFIPPILEQKDLRLLASLGDFLAWLEVTGGFKLAPSVRLK